MRRKGGIFEEEGGNSGKISREGKPGGLETADLGSKKKKFLHSKRMSPETLNGVELGIGKAHREEAKQ